MCTWFVKGVSLTEGWLRMPVKKTNVPTLLVSAPPALPHRPGLSHPLYSYIAGEPHAIALHDFPALQHDELPFQVPVLLLLPLRGLWRRGAGGDVCHSADLSGCEVYVELVQQSCVCEEKPPPQKKLFSFVYYDYSEL